MTDGVPGVGLQLVNAFDVMNACAQSREASNDWLIKSIITNNSYSISIDGDARIVEKSERTTAPR